MAAVPTSYQFIKAVNNNVVIIGLDGITPVVQYSLQPGKDLKIDERNPDNVLIPVEESKGAQNKFLSISYKKMDFANSTPSATNPADITEALDFLSSDFFFELGGGGGGDSLWEVADIGFGDVLVNKDRDLDNGGILLYKENDDYQSAVIISETLGVSFQLLNKNTGDGGIIKVDPTGLITLDGNNNIYVTGFPEYADDAAADADTNLPIGCLYKLTGDRAIYQKP